MKNYYIEKTEKGVELTRENVKNLKPIFIEGKCDMNPLTNEDYRKRKNYTKSILKPLILSKQIDTGLKFDDRKIRYSGARIKGEKLEILAGLTYYQRFEEDFKRTDRENSFLLKRGKEQWQDREIFFSRPMGVEAGLITKDRCLIIGERINEIDKGKLAFIGGYVDYSKNMKGISLIKNLEREILEETGIRPSQIKNYELIGIFSHPFRRDVGIVYLINVDILSNYFFKDELKIKDKEHKKWIKLDSYEEAKQLLNRDNIQFPTYGFLDYITPQDFY